MQEPPGTTPANSLEDFSRWLSIEQVADRLRVSGATVRRRIAKGGLRSQYIQGTLKIDPESVEELADKESGQLPTADIVAVLTTTIKQQQTHNERLVELAAGSSFKNQELLASFAGRQAAQIEKQQDQLEAMRAAHELALSGHYARELAGRESQAAIDASRREAEVKEKHTQQAIDMAKTNVPAVLALLGAKFTPGDPTPQAAGVVALFDSLTPTQLEAIRVSLTREQLTSFLALYDARKRAKNNLEKAEAQAQQDAVAGAGGSSPVGDAPSQEQPPPPTGTSDEQTTKLYNALVETQQGADKAMGVVAPLLQALSAMTEAQRAELIDLVPSDKRPALLVGLKAFL